MYVFLNLHHFCMCTNFFNGTVLGCCCVFVCFQHCQTIKTIIFHVFSINIKELSTDISLFILLDNN